MASIVQAALREAGGDLRRAWPQLLLTDLLTRLVAVVLLTPLVGLLVRVFLVSAEDRILTDAEIAAFLLHPAGIAMLIVVGTVSVSLLFLEQGLLMSIGYGATDGRRVTGLDALRHVGARLGAVVRLARAVVVRLLWVTAPFLAAVVLVYVLFLRSHDINFYLARRPPEFVAAVGLGLALAVAGAIVVLKQLSDWVLGLPVVLFEGAAAREALRQSRQRTAPHAWKIAAALAAWFFGFALLAFAVTTAVAWVGHLVVPELGASTVALAAGLTAALLLGVVANLAVSIVGTLLLPLLLVRMYRALTDPGRRPRHGPSSGTLAGPAAWPLRGRTIALGILVAAAAVVAIACFVAERLDAEDDVLVIAHRGASAAAPENTMAAFERAIADGAGWIELDVQETRDGAVVVAHDSDFMKVAGEQTKVWDATLEELSALDVGKWLGAEFEGQTVPTLAQALELARDRAGVVIELKYYGHDQQLESRVVQLVEEAGMTDRIMIMSLSLPGVRKAAALRPDWSYGLLNTAAVGDLTRLSVDFLALNSRAATLKTIRRAHRRRMKVFAWTVNDPVRMSVMMSRGVDGIITDDPALARRVLEVRSGLGPVGRLLVWIAGEAGLLSGLDRPSPAGDA